MKRTLIPIMSLFLFACSNDELPIVNTDEGNLLVTQELRTEPEAVEIATNALNEFYPLKSRAARDLSNMNVVLLGEPNSRSSEYTNPLYVVNFGDNSGYAIVSANKNVEPLLAITESGSISSLDKIDNPGVGLFVESAMKLEKDTTNKVPDPIIGGELITIYRNDTVFHTNTKVEPRVEVEWGQLYPAGLLCPNGVSGCVPLAGAQALTYFEYPEQIDLSFPERSSDRISLDWKNIKRIVSSTWYGTRGEYDYQLSSICREFGYKINAHYIDNGNIYFNATGAYTGDLRTYLNNLLPKDKFVVSPMYSSNPETNKVLDNGIIIIRADDSKASKDAGHAWVIDGYIYKSYTVYVYAHKLDSPIETLERQFDKTDLYSHANWGWDGSGNGYFYNNVFTPLSHNFNSGIAYFTIKTK